MNVHKRFGSLRRITLTVLLAALPSASFSAGTWTAAPGMVTALYSHDGIHFVQTTMTNAACGSAGKFWWLTSDSDAKDMFALALAAFVAGKRVNVVQDSAAPNCNSGANLATHMAISD